MPLDPSISLDVKPPATPANPLTTIGEYAGIQNQLNQNRLFQQTFAAKQKAGQIIAASPDLESAFTNLAKDPQVAPFAGQIINDYRQGMLAQTQQLGELQTQATTGMDAFRKLLPSMVTNPGGWQSTANSVLSTLSPQVQGQVSSAINNVGKALTDGLPDDPQARTGELNKRLTGFMVSAGVSPDSINATMGTPSTRDVGGSITSGLTTPAFAGGGFIPTNSVGKTLAPQVVNEFGPGGSTQPTIVGGAAGSPANPLLPPAGGSPRTAGAPAGNALGLPSPTQQQAGYLEPSGKAAASTQEELNSAAIALPTAVKRLDLMNQAVQQFQTGGGAELRTHVASLLQAARNAGVSSISDDFINKVSNGSIADSQTFNAMAKPLAVQTLKDVASGTGRVMRSEVDAFLDTIDMNKDPDAVQKILNYSRYVADQKYNQAQAFPQFKQAIATGDPSMKGFDLSDFGAWYAKQQHDIGALDTSPQATGLGGRGNVKRWQVQDGKLVPVGGP